MKLIVLDPVDEALRKIHMNIPSPSKMEEDVAYSFYLMKTTRNTGKNKFRVEGATFFPHLGVIRSDVVPTYHEFDNGPEVLGGPIYMGGDVYAKYPRHGENLGAKTRKRPETVAERVARFFGRK